MIRLCASYVTYGKRRLAKEHAKCHNNSYFVDVYVKKVNGRSTVFAKVADCVSGVAGADMPQTVLHCVG
jgi:hypothetical protein